MRRIVLGISVMAAAGLAGSALRPGAMMLPVAAQAGADKPAYYTESVKPIFVAHCAQCHLGGAHRGGLALDTKAAILKGGRDGAVIVPGDASKSMLVMLIRHEGPADDPKPMPPKEKLSDADIATVTAWIQAGAVMPDDPPAAP